MRKLLIVSVIALALTAHTASQTTPSTAFAGESGIQGQVYRVDAPAVPLGWKPPPLRRVMTILVLDSLNATLNEIKTDSLGTFTILLPPGEYFLQVKESLLPAQTGPFVVPEGRIIQVEADYDGGLR